MTTVAAWGATIGAIVALLVLERAVSRRRRGPVQLRDAAVWSLFYIAVALGFGVVLGAVSGWELGAEYLAGYAVEKSLSIDNVFVFVVIIATFAIPEIHRPRLLTLGILAALVLRGAFIAAGAALLHAFSFAFALFGIVLLITAVQLLRHRGEPPNVVDGPIARRLRSRLPVSERSEGDRLITRRDPAHAGRALTPMGLALVTIVGADVLFGLDSIPAVYGVTERPFVVFSANAFALLGLRPLFFLVSGLVKRLRYLPLGMAGVLGFIGVKLILHTAHTQIEALPTISTPASLAVIVGLLVVTALASLVRTRGGGMGPGPHSEAAEGAAG